MALVTILMGSASDEACVAPCAELLSKLEIDYFLTVTSAHRTPERTRQIVAEQEALGCQVFICAAGMAAHLAGVVASLTTCPVIGLPVAGQQLAGLDALLSTVQMPSGFPVATVALGGAKNAAWLAAEILALHNPDLKAKIVASRQKMQNKIAETGEELSRKYSSMY